MIHVYNSTSVAQREQVFKKDKEQVKQIAIDGAKLLKQLADQTEGNFTFEYSPESFSGTEVDYAVDVCNAVLDVWQPTKDKKVIINIPTTVENAMPHVFACQIEYIHKHLKYRDNVILSVHPHNDRGTGVAATELALLAGAARVEGALFGNGERTGTEAHRDITIGTAARPAGIQRFLAAAREQHRNACQRHGTPQQARHTALTA